MPIEFTKMHGLGNDFMVVDAINQRFQPSSRQIIKWSDRKTGIGFDQLLMVEKPESGTAEFKYRIYNADGGEVSQCGNGARCFARFVREKNLTTLNIVPVETNTGLITLEMIDDIRVRVNMGVPLFELPEIPMRNIGEKMNQQYQLELNGENLQFVALSMGNPHMVMQVDDVDSAAVESLGPLLESHDIFPERANIGFMQIVSPDNFKLRVFERGVGETRACGSGACAAMVAGVELGLLNSSANAELLGGVLNLEWQGRGNPVMMTGDTACVYTGQIDNDESDC